MSRREYKTLNRRLIRGRDSSASEGKWIGSIAPYGYNRVKLPNEKGYTLEPHPEEAPIIRKILRCDLNHQGTKMIANYLNDREVPTRHGDLWTYSTISQIITNPVYMGKIRRGWSRQVKSIENGEIKKRIKRKKDMSSYDIYNGLHPALVSEEDFMKAQKIRLDRKPTAPVREEYQLMNPFSGLLFCSIWRQANRSNNHDSSKKSCSASRCTNSRNCHNCSAYFDVVEKEIIGALKSWLKGYKVKIDTVGYTDDIEDYQKTADENRTGAEKAIQTAGKYL